MAEEDKVIVSRIQHRRGLKQDLPQPLRPGELGLAIDSRQVYIGGDPDNPQSADYNAISYFEATAGAKSHTISIANNNILAFQVPYIKYSKGEFNGISNQKQWQPSDARSIINSSNPDCYYSSSVFPVFSLPQTQTVSSTYSQSTSGSTSIYVSGVSGIDEYGNIRVGDSITGDDLVGNLAVQSISINPGGGYIITVVTQQTVSAGGNITFTPNNIKNTFTDKTFKSSDVIVNKNNKKIVAESNSSLLNAPSATADFALNATDIVASGQHVLTLRTTPTPNDEISVCYYGNANVIQAIEGVNGKIAGNSLIESFYDQYSIPSYRKLDNSKIFVSTTSGLGYIGLDQKHIASSADGANIAPIVGLTLGNLFVNRIDQKFVTSNVAVDPGDDGQWTVTLSSSADNIFSPYGDGGIYRYNKGQFYTTDGGHYFYKRPLEVVSAATNTVTFKLTEYPFAMFKEGYANLTVNFAGNGFTDNVSATSTRITVTSNTDIEGMQIGDYVRIVDTADIAPYIELHDTVFEVEAINQTANTFQIRVDASTIIAANTIPDFTANIGSLAFINHGSDANNANTTIQVHAANSFLSVGTLQAAVTVDGTGSVWQIDESFNIDTARTTDNSFFADISSSSPPTDMPVAELMDELTGSIRANVIAASGTITVAPVLAIDLRNNTTITQAITTVNKSLVSIPDADPINDVSIFPELNWLPQDDGTTNAVYISQRPAYSSIDVGGLEFHLHEDYENNTLSKLGLTPGEYTRDNNTTRAKLENWMNDLVNNRDATLFTNVFTGGDNYKTLLPNNFLNYNLTINDTFGEAFFCTREEASYFNQVVNSVYSPSLFDRAEDDQNGVRGLINLKNNLEIQTREAASFGDKLETVASLEIVTILQSDTENDIIFSLEASQYNSFVLEYTITESAGSGNKYLRVGTMLISARSDWTTDPTNAVVLTDRFTSTTDVQHSDPIVEPKFSATLNGSLIEIRMENQFRDPDNPVVGDYIVHSIGAPLRMKYILKRWSNLD